MSAADLPDRAAPPVIAAVPVFTWTGFYVGDTLGWGRRDDDNEAAVLTGPGIPAGIVGGTLNFDNGEDGNLFGGGQIGYSYQIDSFVVGVEADIQGIATDDNDVVFISGPDFDGGTFVPGEFKDSADWFGTVRLHVGVAFDCVLVYATGGLAYTEDNTGWTVGGVERALPVNWFGSNDEQDFFVACAKLNFKFGTY